jgi:hypothetical protein
MNRPDRTVLSEHLPPAETRTAARATAAREGAGKITINAVAKMAGLNKGGADIRERAVERLGNKIDGLE